MQNAGMQGSTSAGAAREAENLTGQQGGGLGRLSDSAQQTMERFTQAASQAASRLSAQGQQLLQSANAEKAKTYMREHPVASVGIAVAVGLLLSKLLSRR